METFNEQNFHLLCEQLAGRDHHLKDIIIQYGYPPLWSREPGFATLVRIILEQQVSLASAKAAFDKLQAFTGCITPAGISVLTDAELKACYFSRQKTTYVRHLAEAVLSNQVNIKQLEAEPDEVVRTALIKIKGIGNWTIDVYLMMALHRADCFPLGDIALINSFKAIKGLPQAGKEEIGMLSNAWKPYRTVAAYLLWHAYLSKRKKLTSASDGS